MHILIVSGKKSHLYFGWFASAAFAGNLDKKE